MAIAKMSDTPFLSIIIATRNCKEALQTTLEQLQHLQSAFPLEILIADALSTDGTADYIATQAEQLSWWVSEPDAGIYDAWNKCLAQARGQWIAFLGAGDTYTPDGLTKLVQAAQQNPQSHYISCHQWQVLPNGQAMRLKKSYWHPQTFQKRMTLTHVGCFHARNAFAQYGFFDTSYRICADYAWLLRIGTALQHTLVPEPCVNMLIGGISDGNALVFEETARAQRAHTQLPHWRIQLLKQEVVLRKKIRHWWLS